MTTPTLALFLFALSTAPAFSEELELQESPIDTPDSNGAASKGANSGGANSGGASSGSCAAVDLSKKFPPVRDQGAYGSCYAYAAADLMSYPTVAKKEDGAQVPVLPVSAFGTAIQAYKLQGMDRLNVETPDALNELGGLNGGRISWGIRAAAKFGACSESILPSMDFSKVDEPYKELIDAFMAGRKPDKKTPAQCQKPNGTVRMDPAVERLMREEKFKTVAKRFFSYQLRTTAKNLVQNNSPGLRGKDLVNAIERKRVELSQKYSDRFDRAASLAYAQETVPNMLSDLFLHYCTNSPFDRPIWAKTPSDSHELDLEVRGKPLPLQKKRELAMGLIEENLSRRRPVGISYLTGGLIQKENPDQHGRHASVLIGRKEAKGKCFYIVRNSWGKSWPAPGELKGLKAIAVEGLPGHFAVEENDLLGALTAVTVIP